MKSKVNNSTLQRLRIEEVIVGYRKQKGKYTFYSTDQYGWNGTPISYQHLDLSTEYLDQNRKIIFENDIIEFTEKPSEYYIVTFDELINKFYLVDYQTKRIFEKDFDEIISQNGTFKRVSYAFRNN